VDQARLITGAIENIQASASYDERSRTWVVRLGARRQFVEEVAQQQALAAHEEARPVFVEGLHGRAQRREVEPEHLARVEVHECLLS